MVIYLHCICSFVGNWAGADTAGKSFVAAHGWFCQLFMLLKTEAVLFKRVDLSEELPAGDSV